MLVNSGEGEHDIFFPELKVRSKRVTKNGESVSVTFRVPSEEVDLEYYDSVANHAEIGMVGILQVARAGGSQAAGEKVGMSVNNIVAQAFQKGGCGACHTIPGVAGAVGAIGPDLTNIGKVAAERIQSSDYTGSATTAEDYIRESIATPGAFVSPDCPGGPCQDGLMPSLVAVFSADEMKGIVDYLASLPEGANATRTWWRDAKR